MVDRKDILTAAWDFAKGVVKDPSQTFSDVIEGAKVSFPNEVAGRWYNVAYAGLGITALGIGLAGRHPGLVALGAFDLAIAGGRFQEVGENERKDSVTSGPWGDAPKDGDGPSGPAAQP